MKKTLQVLNEMKDAGIISHYAIGGFEYSIRLEKFGLLVRWKEWKKN